MSDYRLDLPEGLFGTIYADPPWALLTGGVRRALHYDRMRTEEIAAIPVGGVCTPDAHLWLWTTNAHLPEALHVMSAWGFRYRTMLTWVKPSMGIGWWLRGRTEHVLFGARTTKKRANPGSVTTVLQALRQKHSTKPPEVRAIIERLSPGPYLELFARQECAGWTCLVSDADPADPYNGPGEPQP